MCLAKYSELTYVLNPIVLRMVQGDIVNQFTRAHLWFWQPDPKDEKLYKIDLSHLLIGIIGFGGGIVIALVVFGFELAKKPK